jgi:transposase
MANEFWLSDDEWAAIEPLVPMDRPGVKPQNNRRVISGILHVLKFGCRWRDCPAVFGPHTTVYNRFNRWSRAGIWQIMFERLVQLDQAHEQSIDSTTSKAHRCSAGGKGGPRRRPSAAAEAGEPPRSTPSSMP